MERKTAPAEDPEIPQKCFAGMLFSIFVGNEEI
jgi:hypothetical protein